MTVDGERAGKRRERNPIAALTRMLAVMAESPRLAMGVRELARDLGTQPSSVQRTLAVAREAGLVAPTAGGQWELGWELFRIASLVQGKQPFAAAGPILDRLSEASGETAVLTVYVPHRRARMFVAASPSRHAVRFEPRLYAWLPMHAGATALAILAHRPDVERRAVYAGALDGLSETTLTSPEQLERALDDVRHLGYAVSRDQVNLGASAVAAPVDSAVGVLSSIGIIAPRERFQEATETVLADAVMAAAAELGNRLGDPVASLRSGPNHPRHD